MTHVTRSAVIPFHGLRKKLCRGKDGNVEALQSDSVSTGLAVPCNNSVPLHSIRNLSRPSSTAAASVQTVQVLAAAALLSVQRCRQARARVLKLRALSVSGSGAFRGC